MAGIVLPACAEMNGPVGPLDPLHHFDALPGPVTGSEPGSGGGSAPVFQWAVPSSVGVHPNYVAVDNVDGYVYVTDTINNSVWKFNSTGGFVGKWGTYGHE